MVVDIRVGGFPKWSNSEVTVSEDSTPLDPSDGSGRVGAISFTIPDGADAKSLLDQAVDVDGGVRGSIQGVVAALSGDGSNVTVEAHSRMVALVANRTALPHVGTLESALLYYFGLCGVSTGIVIDPTVADVPVVALGFYGNVWEYVAKKLCPAYQVEATLIDGDIHVRQPRSVTASRLGESQFSWSLDKSGLAQSVEAWYYPPTEITDALIVGNELSPISNLDAGEVHEFDVDLDASLSSVVQPVAVDSVSFDASTASEYSVLDQFDEPVDADYWRVNGGRVTVQISDDTRSLHVTVVACQERSRAPYRLTGVAISGDEYSTLRVIGTGVAFTRAKYTLPASTDPAVVEAVGAEVDNECLASWGHAHLALLHTAARHGVPVQRITGVAAIREQYGNIAGARVFDDHNVYRIRSATSGATALSSFEAESDVTFADTTVVNAGHEIADWNALWEGRPISEYNLRPLVPLEGEVVPPVEGLYPGSETFPSSLTFPGA